MFLDNNSSSSSLQQQANNHKAKQMIIQTNSNNRDKITEEIWIQKIKKIQMMRKNQNR